MGLLEEARAFAAEAHEGQTRKTNDIPVIIHLEGVAETLKQAGFPEYVVVAGYLHDTVEDTDVTMERIQKEFGDKVAEVVKGNTENKDHDWEMRKQHTIDSIKCAPLEIKALIVADKLDNLSSLIEDYNTYGEDVWAFFNRGKEKQKWYFESIAQNMMLGLEEDEVPKFFHEYKQLVRAFFGNLPS